MLRGLRGVTRDVEISQNACGTRISETKRSSSREGAERFDGETRGHC